MVKSLPLLVAWLALLSGCSDSRRIEPPPFNADDAANKAFADYDKNHDGFLDAKELDHCPALKAALKQLDKDGDGRLSRDELLTRLQEFEDSRVGLYVTTVKVQLDGKPLSGAIVELEPEPFMGTGISAARATTDDAGRAIPKTAQSDAMGCSFGFYRVRISKKDSAGKELIRSRLLGAEVPSGASLVFSLTSN